MTSLACPVEQLTTSITWLTARDVFSQFLQFGENYSELKNANQMIGSVPTEATGTNTETVTVVTKIITPTSTIEVFASDTKPPLSVPVSVTADMNSRVVTTASTESIPDPSSDISSYSSSIIQLPTKTFTKFTPDSSSDSSFPPSFVIQLPTTASAEFIPGPSSDITPHKGTDDPKPRSSHPLGLILGLSIPLSILAIVALAYLLYRWRRSRRRSLSTKEISEGNYDPVTGAEDVPDKSEPTATDGYGGAQGLVRIQETGISELHGEPVAPYTRELQGSQVPQLAELA